MVELLRTPVCFLDSSFNVVVEYSYGISGSLLHGNKCELFRKLFGNTSASAIPSIKSTAYYENYLSVKLIREGAAMGMFIAGPSIESPISDETVKVLVEEHGIPISRKKVLSDYYSSLSILDYTRLVSVGLTLYYMIYNEKLDINEVMEQNNYLEKVMIDIDNNFKNSLSQNKQNIHFHHSQVLEKNLYNCIKDGNKQGILTFMKNPQDGETGVLSRKDPLRSKKNLAICIVVLATRAAMEGGLDSESAYTLSDIYIQGIEEMKEIEDIYPFIAKIACDFADRVNKIKKNKYSPNVNKCAAYISKHLYEDISLSILAKLVRSNPNYLSELLKKELGMPFTTYVQRERIEEAKRLLTFSDYSLTDIAAWLNFHDQSHFTRVFKKHTSTTPKKFRDENLII
jgi:YesN/AraC family two-component response regulator